MKKDLNKKLKKIKLIIFDVDGVLTDGQIVLDHEGNEIKKFDVQDGFGIVLLRKSGIRTAIISARSSSAVAARAEDLKIDKIYQDAHPKIEAYRQLLREFRLKDDEVCFIGDDLPDLAVIRQAGLGVAVNNAVKEVKGAADYVTRNSGGRGAIREVIEMILKGQGKWNGILKIFS